MDEFKKAWATGNFTQKQGVNPLDGLGANLMSEFIEAQLLRKDTEERWLTDLRQYKGQYEPSEEALMQGSKAFARKTRVKVKSVNARLMDMLFPASKERNYDISSTPEPVIPASRRREAIALLTQAKGGEAPTRDEIKKFVKEIADDAASKMATRIDDQLTETKYRAECKAVMHSGHLFGTGILKGPLVERKVRSSYKWIGNSFKQTTRTYAVPFVAQVPIWRYYPDMTVTEHNECRYEWEHHRLSRATLAGMADRKSFNREAILSYIDGNPDGSIKQMTYEQDLRAIGSQQRLLSNAKTGQYDVYERWGWVKAEDLLACGVCVPQDRMQEMFYSNVWLLPDGQVIKAVLSPIDGVQSPYHLYYLDKDETSIWGDGFSSIMRDDQSLINSGLRMMVDNAAVCAGPQFEAFVPAFPIGTNFTDIHPLKVWPRSGGDFQYPALRALNFDSHTPELMALVKMFDEQADETTAVPKFTYGDGPDGGAGKTMGGLSMLLGQANITLKDLVINWDEGITKPFIAGLYHWNMQFSKDESIKGDYDVSATGAASLVAKEVRANTLSQFSATLQPEERPFVKWESLVRQKALVQELEDLTKTQQEVDDEQKTPEFQMQQKMQQMQQELAIKGMEAELGKLQATITHLTAQAEKVGAETERIMAETIDTKVKAAYSAMQAAGVIATNPTIAPIGDALMNDAGWVGKAEKDALQAQQEQQAMLDEQEMAQQQAMQDEEPPAEIDDMTPDMLSPLEPESPATGQEAGIETEAVPL
jgi:hypothetical protein